MRFRKRFAFIALSVAVCATLVFLLFTRPSTDSSQAQHAVSPSVSVSTPPLPNAELTQDKAITLAGRVRGATGNQIEGARIVVLRGEQVLAGSVTNEKGEFGVTTPTGEFVIKTVAKGYGASVVYTVAPTLDIDITLFPGNSVSGRVLYEESRRLVANVQVVAAPQPGGVAGGWRSNTVETDAQGAFRFDDLTAGSWYLSVQGPGVAGKLNDPIGVTLDDQVKDVELLVKPAAKVTGRMLVGTDDQPCIAGRVQLLARASARAASEALDVVTVPVDATGQFKIAALPHGNYRVGAQCDEHRFVEGPTTLMVDERPVSELRYRFEQGNSVIATVRDEANRPIALASVSLAAASEAGLSPAQIAMARRGGLTDEQGQYRFGGLRPGIYRATATYTAINGKAKTEQIVAVQDGATQNIDMTLPGAGSIRIHVQDASGQPVSRMLFFALDDKRTRYEAKYRGDGRFEIGPLPSGGYRAFAYDNKNAKVPLQNGAAIAVQGTNIDMDFRYEPQRGRLEGRVLDYAGTPLSGALVRVVSATLDEADELYSFIQVGARGSQELMTDRDGRFLIGGLNERAAYDVHVDHRSGLQEIRYGVSPGAFVQVSLPPPSRVVGRVVDADGRAVSRFDVVASNARTGGTRSRSYAQAQGYFDLDNVVPGDVTIAVYDSTGDFGFERSASLTAGQALDLGVVMLLRIGASSP